MADALSLPSDSRVLEVGPGMGALTKHLLHGDIKVVEVDAESVEYLNENYIQLSNRIISADFLKLDLSSVFSGKSFSLVGNFPYNISSQILFHALEYRELVPEIMGMFQKEVAQRIAAPPGNKQYGILSVLMQAYFQIDYLFDVPASAFAPPPKVVSGVILAKALPEESTKDIPYKKLKQLVKMAFNQRRKTLRNALSALNQNALLDEMELSSKRAEQLSVSTFIRLAKELERTE